MSLPMEQGQHNAVCQAQFHLKTMASKAQEIAARSPDAVRAIKQLFNASQGMSEADALQLEAKLQIALLGSPNQLEAVAANMEKRAPKFVDGTED